MISSSVLIGSDGLRRAVLAQQVREERRDVLRVHLARVIRHERRRIGRPQDGDAAVHDDLVRPRQLAVAAALGRQIDDDRARRHRFHHLGRQQDRRPLAGDQRRGDDDSLAATTLSIISRWRL